MVLLRHPKWIYAVAGSGVVLGFLNYFQSEKKVVRTAWTNNFEPSVKWDNNWDKRDYSSYIKSSSDKKDSVAQNKINEEKSRAKPTARRYIFLIRHGQYNETSRNDLERNLTEIGRQQADLVGQRLQLSKLDFTKMVRSTMTRAQETADIILNYFPNLPVEDCDLLREGAPIKPEPPSKSFILPDEKFLQDGPRIEAAFQKHFHRADPSQKSDSYEIMVCHGNVIRYFLCRLLQFPPQAWLRFQLCHCSISCVVILPSGVVIVNAIGDHGFLPRELVTN